ncbi:MAG: hypothetical protein FWH44_05065 [Methanomassiliicoccaceae archaeon]|nr:hypothetical protein [Methanomassiliicoccaceae archaeon]
MATSSFDEMMVIDTPEKARNLEAAFWEAEKRGPLKLDHIGIEEELREGEEFIKNNPNWLKEAVAKARKWAEQNGVEIEDISY